MTNPETQKQAHAPVAVGLVGYGWWGKTIARQLAHSPWLKLAAVAEVDGDGRAAMATDAVLAGVLVYATAGALLAHAGLDALILCREHVGDFGNLVYACHDCQDKALGKRSMELIATEVMPRVNAAINR